MKKRNILIILAIILIIAIIIAIVIFFIFKINASRENSNQDFSENLVESNGIFDSTEESENEILKNSVETENMISENNENAQNNQLENNNTESANASNANNSSNSSESSNNSNSSNSSNSSSSTNSSSSNNSSGTNGSSSSSSSSSANGSSKPTHVHNWKDHTAQRLVSKKVTVVDEPAKTVQGAQLYTQHDDGTWHSDGKIYWFENGFTLDDFKTILKNKIRNEGYMGNYVNRTKTIEAVTHEEDQEYYETYVDYQYCDCGARR